MELKSYQQRALDELGRYLVALREHQGKAAQVAALNLGISYDWEREAWRATVRGAPYTSHLSGHGQPVPTVCFKIPTGGGKTLLATRSIDAINTQYRHSPLGFVLWVVPTRQIYRQTLAALRNRAHPYRQSLDLASGGRTVILEKATPFSAQTVDSSLAIMLLMLPAANRKDKATLRMFQDQSGFESFFPAEDDTPAQAALLDRVPNLDTYADSETLIKSSLGNTLRLLNPLLILDESHKAYSPEAQATLFGFNPSFVLELSATPTRANTLVSIGGRELHREGMIKLDIHLHNQASRDWRDTVVAGHRRRVALEELATREQANGGVYIRPINLIQVERTGDKQRNLGLTHAEEVREYLIAHCQVLPVEIAVKSSTRDEIEDIDLLRPDCPIRYIITKQALQEGWDCPFAYVLTVLTNPKSTTGMTQLVGRILRQPYARKTGLPALDESYVYCYQGDAVDVLGRIQKAMQDEGLGDVAQHVVSARPGQALSAALIARSGRSLRGWSATSICHALSLPTAAAAGARSAMRPTS